MANVTKSLIGLDDSNSITFKRINTSPEEYTNVHTILFNGDQKEFEISSESDGGFSKLVNAVSIDWQGAIMPNTATLLELPDITLNDTAQLIDIIERICAKLNDGGIPEPIEPEEPVINSININGSTNINIEKFYKESYTPPVITANMSNGTQRTLDNDELTWSITSDTESLSLTGATVTCIKIGTGVLTGKLNSDNTKTITINITVKPVDIGSNKVSLSGYNNSIPWELDQTITQNTIVLKYFNFETLIENTHYTVEYTNNICTEENQYVDTTATITFRAKGNSNYTGERITEFTIKGQEQQVEYYWYCGKSYENSEDTTNINVNSLNLYIPNISDETIVIDFDGEHYSTKEGWRHIDTSANYIYNPSDPNGRNGYDAIYVDGLDDNGNELPYNSRTNVDYYVLVPTELNIKLINGVGLSHTKLNTVTINSIQYDLHVFNGTKLLYNVMFN